MDAPLFALELQEPPQARSMQRMGMRTSDNSGASDAEEAGSGRSGGTSAPQRRALPPTENKFHQGNADDGKHYWLTPAPLMAELQAEFAFTFDACPYPVPDGFDGLTCEWGASTYANIPFGAVIHEGKKKGATAWARKAIAENKKGKRIVMLYPVDKWLLMMLAAGAKVRNLGDVRWCATEDGSQGKGTGRHIAAFILEVPTGGGGAELVGDETGESNARASSHTAANELQSPPTQDSRKQT